MSNPANLHAKVTLIQDRNLNQSDRLMLIRLTSQPNILDQSGISLEEMSNRMNVPRATLQRSLRRLVKAGYLIQGYTSPPQKRRLLSINEEKLEAVRNHSNESAIATFQRIISLYHLWLRFSEGQNDDLPENLVFVFNNKTALLVLAALTIQADSYQAVRGVSTADLRKLTGASIEYINQTRRLLARRGLLDVLPGWHAKGIMDRPTSTYLLRECKPITSIIPSDTRVINAKFIDVALQPVKVANLFNLKRPQRLVHRELPNIEKTRNLQALESVRAVASNAAELALFIYFKHKGINFTWISIPQKLDTFYRKYAEFVEYVFKSLGDLDKHSPQLLGSISKAYTESVESFDTKFIDPLSVDERNYLRSLAILVCEILLQSGWKHIELSLNEMTRPHEIRLANFPCTGGRFQLLAIPDDV